MGVIRLKNMLFYGYHGVNESEKELGGKFEVDLELSTSLKMVVTQRLLKTKDGLGRVGAFEVMKCNAPIQNLIREAKIHQIPSIMQTAVKDGMITMSKSLENLAQAGKIDANSAKEN